MVQLIPKRGSLPLYSPRFGGTSVRPASAPQAGSVKFGGLPGLSGLGSKLGPKLTNLGIPIFQNISEVFICSFLAQDLLSMVLPRIFKGTFRGREPYEPSQDPNAKNLPFKEQFKLYVRKNIQGLNWSQGTEETKREFTAGPGLLVIPAVALAFASKTFGKTALELSAPALEGLSHGFIQQLRLAEQNLKPGQTLNVREILQKHLDNLFVDPEFRSQNKTFLKDWTTQWAEALEKHAGNAKARNEALAPLTKSFEEKVWDFNRRNLLQDVRVKLPGSDAEQVFKRNLHRSDQVLVNLGGKASQEEVKPLMKDLVRWSDYAHSVTEQAEKLKKPLAETAEKVLKRLVTKKFLLGAGLTTVGAIYLIRITKWAMSNDSYQANRLLQLPAPGAKPAGAAPVQAAPQAGGHA